MRRNYFKLIVSIIIPILAGFLGSIFTSQSVNTWYQLINKPSFNPPDWIFAPVWTTLFIIMGFSLYIIWNKGFDKKEVKVGIILFGIQLFFNIVWSLLFFLLRQPLLAFIDIIILWIFILITIIWFFKISKTAAFLLIPYVLWVSFASILNFYIYILN